MRKKRKGKRRRRNTRRKNKGWKIRLGTIQSTFEKRETKRKKKRRRGNIRRSRKRQRKSMLSKFFSTSSEARGQPAIPRLEFARRFFRNFFPEMESVLNSIARA